MSDDTRRGSAATTVLAFLAGAALGAGVALLLAPRSGKETREKLGSWLDEAAGEAGERARKVREAAGRAVSVIEDAWNAGRKET